MSEVLHIALAILGWTAFGLAVLAGLALDVLGLFGNWIILLAVASAAAFSGFHHFGGWTLPMLIALATFGEVIEAAAAGAGVKRYGGGKGAMLAAIAGTMIGAAAGTPFIPVPILGTIIGACAGAFIFAGAYEVLVSRRRLPDAARAGYGAALGKIAGMFAKTLVGFIMLFTAFMNY